MNGHDSLLLALKALKEYDQFGYITNHQFVMRELLTSLPDGNKNQELLEISSMLMIKTIEQAKRGTYD
jgi:hypothetical protein